MTVTLKGLAWDNRRATAPLPPLLAAFRTAHPGIDLAIAWDVRPLADFEHQTIAEIAGRYDLLIVDHPFCGDIVEGAAFVDLAPEAPELFGPGADALYIGPSLASYRYAGGVWAAPIDGATMHAAVRPDLMGDTPLPATWDEALALGPRLRARGQFLGLAVHTPHAAAAMFSLLANQGRAIPTDPQAPFTPDRADLGDALDLVAALLAFAPPEARGWSSIALHKAMVARDDIAYCPAVYGYATYGEADMRRRLGFGPFAGVSGPSGSMIGGTGLAVSAFSAHRAEAVAFARFAAQGSVQDPIVGGHHGQPATIGAWADPALDARFNGFFSGARSSMETAWVRPRRPGYIPFQNAAGIAVERFFLGELDRPATLDAILAAAALCDAQPTTKP